MWSMQPRLLFRYTWTVQLGAYEDTLRTRILEVKTASDGEQ